MESLKNAIPVGRAPTERGKVGRCYTFLAVGEVMQRSPMLRCVEVVQPLSLLVCLRQSGQSSIATRSGNRVISPADDLPSIIQSHCHAKTETAASLRRRDTVAKAASGAESRRGITPRAATGNVARTVIKSPRRAIGGSLVVVVVIAILHPLPHVSGHVVKSKWIWFE